MRPTEYSFARYLAAKQTVDDRALNRSVWAGLVGEVSGVRALRVLEVGGGIGVMLERLVAWDLLGTRTGAAQKEPAILALTMIDAEPASISEAGRRESRWAAANDLRPIERRPDIRLSRSDLTVSLELEAIDLFEYAERESGRRSWDLLIAHAVLDLLDVRHALRVLLPLVHPGGLFYFTIAFDGVTAFEPAIEPAFDALVERLYHSTSDERVVDGAPSGDSHTGRHLFHLLRASGTEVLAAGGSDWVVFSGPAGYPADEAYFLHFIIHTIEVALRNHPALDQERFAAWIETRHAQIERGELVYIAHQLDVLGRVPAPGRAAQPSGPS